MNNIAGSCLCVMFNNSSYPIYLIKATILQITVFHTEKETEKPITQTNPFDVTKFKQSIKFELIKYALSSFNIEKNSHNTQKYR